MSEQRPPTLTRSSYAVLGLLCVKPWSAYGLAKQMRRSVGWYWPRATSGVYQEPKKLAEHGYATARLESTGGRDRTVYEVTAAGRAAMAAWLTEAPSDPPELASEQLVRVLLPDAGDRSLLLANLRAFADQVDQRLDDFAEQMASYGAPDAPFPDRRFSQLLAGRLVASHLQALRDWATWAVDEVERWPGESWEEASDAARDALVDLARRAAPS